MTHLINRAEMIAGKLASEKPLTQAEVDFQLEAIKILLQYHENERVFWTLQQSKLDTYLEEIHQSDNIPDKSMI